MSDLQRLSAWFRAQVGTRETGENNVVYNTDYYGSPVQGAAYPWCCAFIWDGFHQTGLSALFCGGAKTAYCPFVVEWARAHGRWYVGDYKPGDLLLYDWNGDGVADHIGFSTGWNGTYATSIEGNTDDQVREETRYPSTIMGAYRPEYREDGGTIPPSYVVQRGDTLWDIAARLLGSGLRWTELAAFNGLSGDTIHPGQVLRIPGAGLEAVTVTLRPSTIAALRAINPDISTAIETLLPSD